PRLGHHTLHPLVTADNSRHDAGSVSAASHPPWGSQPDTSKQPLESRILLQRIRSRIDGNPEDVCNAPVHCIVKITKRLVEAARGSSDIAAGVGSASEFPRIGRGLELGQHAL